MYLLAQVNFSLTCSRHVVSADLSDRGHICDIHCFVMSWPWLFASKTIAKNCCSCFQYIAHPLHLAGWPKVIIMTQMFGDAALAVQAGVVAPCWASWRSQTSPMLSTFLASSPVPRPSDTDTYCWCMLMSKRRTWIDVWECRHLLQPETLSNARWNPADICRRHIFIHAHVPEKVIHWNCSATLLYWIRLVWHVSRGVRTVSITKPYQTEPIRFILGIFPVCPKIEQPSKNCFELELECKIDSKHLETLGWRLLKEVPQTSKHGLKMF